MAFILELLLVRLLFALAAFTVGLVLAVLGLAVEVGGGVVRLLFWSARWLRARRAGRNRTVEPARPSTTQTNSAALAGQAALMRGVRTALHGRA